MCMRVYVCACVHACVCTCEYVCVRVLCVRVCMPVCVSVCVRVLCVSIYVCNPNPIAERPWPSLASSGDPNPNT